MVGTEALRPGGKAARDLAPHALPTLKLDAVALTVVEADRLDPVIAVKRPSETDGRVLPAGKEHQRAGLM
jgi:hypothetical protein